MSFKGRTLGYAVAAILTLAPVANGQTPGADPADLVFWQSISNSTNPEEYKAYLQAFPNGRFASIARLRVIQPPAPAPAAGPAKPVVAQAPAPVANPVAEPDPDAPSLAITPANGRVGQKFVASLMNFPETDTRDMVVVVPAGSPVMNPYGPRDQTKVLWSGYPANVKGSNGTLRDIGPFAPGRYELRWMSVLYNNEQTYENKATVVFTVR